MKRIVLLAIALAGAAWANPVCINDTIANYITNYTSVATACQIGDKLFYNFGYSGTANNAVAPTSSQVNVNADTSDPNEPGLIFTSSGWTVNALSSSSFSTFIDSNIHFTVAAIGLSPITDASLDFNNQFTVAGLGQAQIGETITPVTPPGSGVALSVDSNLGPFTSVVGLPPSTTLAISKDLVVRIPRTLNTGVSSSATITSFREGFSENTPEPVSMLLIGSGLLGLAAFRRRRA